jgi:hypothetical protein
MDESAREWSEYTPTVSLAVGGMESFHCHKFDCVFLA